MNHHPRGDTDRTRRFGDASVCTMVAGQGEEETQGEMQGVLASVESLTARSFSE